MLNFEITGNVGSGKNGCVAHMPNNVVHIFFEVDNKIYEINAPTPLGNFEGLTFSTQELTCNDSVVNMTSDYVSGRLHLVWGIGTDIHRTALYPDPNDKMVDFKNGFVVGLVLGSQGYVWQDTVDKSKVFPQIQGSNPYFVDGLVAGLDLTQQKKLIV